MTDSTGGSFFDVVVVGGGPAGSAAAYTLATGHLSTCIIDKSEFPREKLCGGLVTQRSKSTFEYVFERQWDDDLVLASNNINFCFNGNRLVGLGPKEHDTVMYFTMRVSFDAYLLKMAEQAGATLKLGTRVQSIDLDSNSVLMETGEKIGFRFLVGADGVNSQVAKQLYGESFNPNKIGFGLEVEVPRDQLPGQLNTVEIDFAAARWGYGWIFPKKETYTIGVGGIHKLNPDLKAQLRKYLSFKHLDLDAYRVKGQYIPFGDYRRTPGRRNILLCGDAAGTVDPITGEGIAYAMQTGHAAGITIIESGSLVGVELIKSYLTRYRIVSRSIAKANRWRYLIFPAPIMKTFAWAFADAGTLQRGYLDLLAGKHDYDALGGLFVKQAIKGFRKLLRKIKLKLGIGRSGPE